MFNESMDNIETIGKKDENFDKIDNLEKKIKDNQSNISKLNERDRFFHYDEPNKTKIDDPQDTFSDKKKIIADEVNGRGINTLPGFEKKIGNKHISVESHSDSFRVSVTGDQGGWIDIVFNNIPQSKEQQKKDVQFVKTYITGDVLDSPSLKQFDLNWAKEFPNGLNSSDNPQDVKDVILGIEKLVINPEIHAVHGNVEKQKIDEIAKKEEKEKKYDELVVLLNELSFDPQKSNEEIEKYLINSANFIQNHYKYPRQILVSLCILHRHSSFAEIFDKMDKPNHENLQENTQRNADEKNIDDGEMIIEYLSNNPALQKKLVDEGDFIINQAIHSLENSAINNIFPSADEIAFLQS